MIRYWSAAWILSYVLECMDPSIDTSRLVEPEKEVFVVVASDMAYFV
jgi:hypothetical protein